MSGATKADAKRKVVGLYAQGEDHLKVRLRAVGDWLGVPQGDISDVLSLCHALQKAGVSRLFHSLFIDCLYIYGKANGNTDLSHSRITAASKIVLGMGLRARPTWLKNHKPLAAFSLGCDTDDLSW